MTKLAIFEEREEDKWEHITVVKCWRCDPSNGLELPDLTGKDAETELGKKAKSLVDGVMHSLSSARQSEVKAWEEEIEACEFRFLCPSFFVASDAGGKRPSTTRSAM